MKRTSRIVTNELETILKGLYKASDIVTSTMGGAGKNVIITNSLEETYFTKDGVSVADSLKFEDVQENVGAQLLINAAKKTVEEHGDGTTLTSLFTKEFAKNLSEEIKKNPDTDINELIDSIKTEIELVKQKLKDSAKKVDSNHDIYSIAYTSAKSSRLAAFIAEIYSKTGLKANISLENSRTSNSSYYELIKGMTFESGFVHSSFANNDNGTCYFENPFIFITNESMTVPADFEELIEVNFKNNTPIVFIAPNYSDAFIRYCLTNKQRVGLEICLIKTPGYGASVKENIRDIKAFINSDSTCSSIKITPVEFTIYNEPDTEKIKKRVLQLTAMADDAVDKYDEDSYRERISNIQQNSAIIYVGGITAKNAKEEYDRLEDAIGAVKSAIREGYVRGAGVELYNIVLPVLDPDSFIVTEKYNSIIKEVCQKPYLQILENARLNPVKFNFTKAYNIRTKQYDENLIDPVGMICSALDNAFALIELLINSSYLIYND